MKRVQSCIIAGVCLLLSYLMVYLGVPLFVHQVTLEETFRPRNELAFDLVRWPQFNSNRLFMANRMVRENAFIGAERSHLWNHLGEPQVRSATSRGIYDAYRLCLQSDAPAKCFLFPSWFSNVEVWYLIFDLENDKIVRSRIQAN